MTYILHVNDDHTLRTAQVFLLLTMVLWFISMSECQAMPIPQPTGAVHAAE